MKKTAIAATVFALTLRVNAAPTPNNYAAVTNDWYNGRWTNVMELAQTRLAANGNDLVGAHLMVSYDILFSDVAAMSNSVERLIRAMDATTAPALTNICSRMRPGWVEFRNLVIPALTPTDVQAQRAKSSITGKPLDCDFILKSIWDNNLW